MFIRTYVELLQYLYCVLPIMLDRVSHTFCSFNASAHTDFATGCPFPARLDADYPALERCQTSQDPISLAVVSSGG